MQQEFSASEDTAQSFSFVPCVQSMKTIHHRLRWTKVLDSSLRSLNVTAIFNLARMVRWPDEINQSHYQMELSAWSIPHTLFKTSNFKIHMSQPQPHFWFQRDQWNWHWSAESGHWPVSLHWQQRCQRLCRHSQMQECYHQGQSLFIASSELAKRNSHPCFSDLCLHSIGTSKCKNLLL